MKNKTLYFQGMGMDNNNLPYDIKNHRVRLIGLIPTVLHENPIFMEFDNCKMLKPRYTHKITGAPLKHYKMDCMNTCGLHINTEVEINKGNYFMSYRLLDFEKSVFQQYLNYSTDSILKVVNSVSIEKYNKVVFIEQEAKKIIEKFGGYREKEILKNDSVFCVTEDWNESHKVVKVQSRINHKLDDFCTVDLITCKIVG